MTSPKPSRKNTVNLTSNNEAFHLLFANHPIPMWVYDLKTLAFLEVNDAAVEKYGYTCDEFLALTIKDIRPKEDVERLTNTLEQKHAPLNHSGEWRHLLKNGQIINVEITTHALDFEGHKAALVMAQDITERKQAEEALKIKEWAIESAIEAIAIADLAGNLTYVNSAFLNLWGYASSTEVLGKPSTDFWQTGDQATEVVEALRNQGGWLGEMTAQRKDGASFLAQVGSSMVRDIASQPICMLASFTDITESKRAAEKLHKSELTLHSFIANSPDTMYLLDLEDHTSKYLNCEEFCGYPKSILESPASIMFALHADDVPAIQANWQQMLHASDDEVSSCEYRLQRKDGNWEWIQQRMTILSRTVDGEPSQVLVTLSIITERKQVEEKLIVSETRYRRLFEAAKDGILILDAETGVVVDVNPFLCEMLGFSHEEICGKELWEMGFFKDTAESKANFLELQQKGFIRYDDLPLEIANGRKFHVEFVSNVYQVNHHKVIQCNIRDITERKQAEQKISQYSEHLEEMVQARTSELRVAQEKLVRNEKLAMLGQLAGGVGHELRNPLAVINNALYYLKLIGANSNEKVKEYLGIIETEAHTAEKIIADLLDFARIKSVDVEPVPALRLVERVLERYPAHKAVSVRLEIPEDLPMLYADPRQMEQVLGNLVINACQAMSTGGELTITAHREQETIAIAVQDTGTGITPENMKMLFEPLFTTKAKGIGLGLAVSQKLVEANGGRIEVESEAGKGSTFTVVLPVQQG